jgi:purine-binding chemotaxis protein CheW
VKGVVNLRGQVIPVVDLRLKFGFDGDDYDRRTCIIVVDVEGVHMGIVVDTVSEVLDIQKGDIEATPSFGTKLDTDFILGMGKVNDKVKVLLDIGKVLTTEELKRIRKMEV